MRLVCDHEIQEMTFALAMAKSELAIWRMFGNGEMTAEQRDVVLQELAKLTREEIFADLAVEDRAAAPK